MVSPLPPVILFGYDSSPFTQKIRLVLRLKQIPYTYVTVSSKMPRPVLRDNFNLTYRKIPVLVVGREVYCDTSIITEILETVFSSKEYPSLYPLAADGRDYRAMMRGFASHWIDRPFFRVTCNIIPASVWYTDFSRDRAGLIGHPLDPDKLAAKIPSGFSNLDLHLSMMEPLFHSGGPWIFSTKTPSFADCTLYYQLKWGLDISAGRGIHDLTGGDIPDTDTEGASSVFNAERYPGLYKWYAAMTEFIEILPLNEKKVSSTDKAATADWLSKMKSYSIAGSTPLLHPTPKTAHSELDKQNGLVAGVQVSIAPDDTGKDDPTIGTLVDMSPEEVVIKAMDLEAPAPVDVRVHFPRLGFVVEPLQRRPSVARAIL